MSNTLQAELETAHIGTIASLTEFTQDPIDAMRLASDLYAMSAYRAERAVALEAGGRPPRAPKLRSRFVHLLTTSLKAKLNVIASLFGSAELDRLKKLGPALARRLDRNDPGLAEELYELVCMEPEDAVAWIREHRDEIEARFAS